MPAVDADGDQPSLASSPPAPVAADPSAAVVDPPSPKSRVKGKEVVEDALPDVSTWTAVGNVVLAVAEHLETAPVVQRLREAFARGGAGGGAARRTWRGELEEVLSKELGYGTATFAVFRGCHQSILFAAVYQLKTSLYGKVGQMKDVRRKDGWTVEIYVGEGRVWVTHERTEQSMEPEDDPGHFEVRWEIKSQPLTRLTHTHHLRAAASMPDLCVRRVVEGVGCRSTAR